MDVPIAPTGSISSARIDIVVRANSFGSFHDLRTALKELGYGFSLLLCEDAAPVDRGGSPRGVQ